MKIQLYVCKNDFVVVPLRKIWSVFKEEGGLVIALMTGSVQLTALTLPLGISTCTKKPVTNTLLLLVYYKLFLQEKKHKQSKLLYMKVCYLQQVDERSYFIINLSAAVRCCKYECVFQ